MSAASNAINFNAFAGHSLIAVVANIQTVGWYELQLPP
jgi:hypothetical protein